jgi:hypothetical protein
MRGLICGAFGVAVAVIWLLLVEATDFNGATIGFGMLLGFGLLDRVREATA